MKQTMLELFYGHVRLQAFSDPNEEEIDVVATCRICNAEISASRLRNEADVDMKSEVDAIAAAWHECQTQ